MEDIEKNTGRVVVTSVIKKNESSRHMFTKGDVLYSRLRPYLNKVVVAEYDGYASSEINVLTLDGSATPYYLQLVLMSPYFVEYATSKSYGVKMPRLGTEDGRAALIPIPSLNEQCRIVEKVDSLISFIGQFGQLFSHFDLLPYISKLKEATE